MMRIFAILTTLAVSLVPVESTEYKHHIELKPGVFDVYWSVNTTDIHQTFSFKFVAKTTGWAALGWSKTPNGEKMIQYDIGLGGVRNNGSAYLQDYWSGSLGKPDIDQNNQNLNLVNASEAGGFTTIEFTRPADTLDSATADVPLENGTRIWLMWAIANTDATGPETFVKHSERGYTSVAYNMFTRKQFEALSTTPSPSTTAKPTGTGVVATRPSLVVTAMASLLLVLLFLVLY